jgi:hypothetical protein
LLLPEPTTKYSHPLKEQITTLLYEYDDAVSNSICELGDVGFKIVVFSSQEERENINVISKILFIFFLLNRMLFVYKIIKFQYSDSE